MKPFSEAHSKARFSVSPSSHRVARRLHPRYLSPLSLSPIPFHLNSELGDMGASLQAITTGALTTSSSAQGGITIGHSRNFEDPAAALAGVADDLIVGLTAVAEPIAEVIEPLFLLEGAASGDECEVGGSGNGEPNGSAFPELLAGDLPWEVDNTFNFTVQGGSSVSARILDEEYLTTCRFYHHDPRRPLPTNLDILFRMGKYFGSGVTRSELRQALRRCKACRRFMYADNRGSHRCDAEALSTTEERDLISAFLSVQESSGFASQDLRSQLIICASCDHVLQSNVLAFHDCDAA
ncbi:hypothetical protein NMY22_g9232 [Coprinellus aureogranulatus]|nr:hypothetical protein NMY22_g9232 [Coprinellus aureogranulatus]